MNKIIKVRGLLKIVACQTKPKIVLNFWKDFEPKIKNTTMLLVPLKYFWARKKTISQPFKLPTPSRNMF